MKSFTFITYFTLRFAVVKPEELPSLYLLYKLHIHLFQIQLLSIISLKRNKTVYGDICAGKGLRLAEREHVWNKKNQRGKIKESSSV